MSIFSSSSQQNNRRNNDGSRNVMCYVCGQFICTTFLQINRALCALCERAEKGEPVPEEAIRNYQIGKLDKADVSVLVMEDPSPSVLTKRFSLRSMGSNIMKAFGIGKKKVAPIESRIIADKKKRKRLFENIDRLDKK